MTAYNVVRFRVKPGREKDFVALHTGTGGPLKGLRKGTLIKTGDRTYCFVGEWDEMGSIGASPEMIAEMGNMLEDLGGGLGVTDSVAGDVVAEMKP